MPDRLRLSDPVFTSEDVEELARWILDTIAADPAAAAIAGGRIAAEWYARTRAAQLLGMRLDRATGEYVPAARAPYRVAQDLREKVQDVVTDIVAKGASVADLNRELAPLFEQITGRSQVIARTETANALNAGTLASLEEQGVELVEVIDGPGCLPEGHADGAPDPDPDVIGVQADRQANGQVWRTAEAAELLIGHPNCTRSLIARY